jgi:hypothetical protein
VAAAVMNLALSGAAQKEVHMVHAQGSFEVKMTPGDPTDFERANDIARFTSDKIWHGDFEGVSRDGGTGCFYVCEELSNSMAHRRSTADASPGSETGQTWQNAA